MNITENKHQVAQARNHFLQIMLIKVYAMNLKWLAGIDYLCRKKIKKLPPGFKSDRIASWETWLFFFEQETGKDLPQTNLIFFFYKSLTRKEGAFRLMNITENKHQVAQARNHFLQIMLIKVYAMNLKWLAGIDYLCRKKIKKLPPGFKSDRIASWETWLFFFFEQETGKDLPQTNLIFFFISLWRPSFDNAINVFQSLPSLIETSLYISVEAWRDKVSMDDKLHYQ